MKRLLALVLALICLGSCAAIAEEKPKTILDEIQTWLVDWDTSMATLEDMRKDCKLISKETEKINEIDQTALKYEVTLQGLPATLGYTFLNGEKLAIIVVSFRAEGYNDLNKVLHLSASEFELLASQIQESYPGYGYIEEGTGSRKFYYSWKDTNMMLRIQGYCVDIDDAWYSTFTGFQFMNTTIN